MTLFSFDIQDIHGNPVDWKAFQGKKIMVVNTASECGLTPQYKQLEAVYQQYKDANFTIIAFPSNDFGAQEPGTNEQIAAFCEQNYGVSFPLMDKIAVTGPEQHPLYKWLCAEMDEAVTWNFQKFLINADGEVIESIDPRVLPDDPEIIRWIES